MPHCSYYDYEQLYTAKIPSGVEVYTNIEKHKSLMVHFPVVLKKVWLVDYQSQFKMLKFTLPYPMFSDP